MNPNFIGQYMIDNLSICDKLIDIYNKSDKKFMGTIGGKIFPQPEYKQSTEIAFSVNDILLNSIESMYLQELAKCCDKYKEEYKYSGVYGAWKIIEHFKFQHYKPNEGYHIWHTERDHADPATNNRHLVWMTYLNDVDDAGETEFYYQALKVKPRKGLTLIWPVDWTHTHHGIASPTQHKYIMTGWYSYYNE
jgi:hypothetical protein